MFQTSPKEFCKVEDSTKIWVSLNTKDQVNEPIEFDAVLIATGRVANVEGLGLEAAGIKFDSKGVKVDKHLQTSNSNVFACGDCIEGYKFTHNSDI